jgi:hypothetical protein
MMSTPCTLHAAQSPNHTTAHSHIVPPFYCVTAQCWRRPYEICCQDTVLRRNHVGCARSGGSRRVCTRALVRGANPNLARDSSTSETPPPHHPPTHPPTRSGCLSPSNRALSRTALSAIIHAIPGTLGEQPTLFSQSAVEPVAHVGIFFVV